MSGLRENISNQGKWDDALAVFIGAHFLQLSAIFCVRHWKFFKPRFGEKDEKDKEIDSTSPEKGG